jgi:hypothetical protein
MRIFRSFNEFWYRTKHSFISLWVWFPVIWNDRQWDFNYFYKILRHKINLQLKYAMEKDRVLIQEKENLERCIFLLDRIIEEDYDEIYRLEHEKKWGAPVFHYYPTENGAYRIEVTHPNVKTEEDEELMKKEFNDNIWLANNQLQKDKTELFDIINDNIDKWWD